MFTDHRNGTFRVRIIGPEVIMDIQEALKIMRALANGTKPENGETLEESSVCRQPQTVRAPDGAISARCRSQHAR
jgi:hypothetical protein